VVDMFVYRVIAGLLCKQG